MNPDIPALIAKWQCVLDVVLVHNVFDTPQELAWLCEASSTRSRIIEVGSYKGVSAKAMLLANPSATLWTLDLWEDVGSNESYRALLKPEIDALRVKYHRGPSREGLDMLVSYGHKSDMIFLDGSHTEDGVKSDIVGSAPLLEAGALLCGHDFRVNDPNDGVTRAVRELLPDHVVVTDSIWAALV